MECHDGFVEALSLCWAVCGIILIVEDSQLELISPETLLPARVRIWACSIALSMAIVSLMIRPSFL